MAKLEINGINIPLGESRKLVFSRSAYSESDWLTKDIGISERVRVPETNISNNLFGNPSNVNSKSNTFNKFYSFNYKEEDSIVYSGAAILLGANDSNEYELQLLDSSKALFDSIKKNLNRLNVDVFDFIFNIPAYNSLKIPTDSIWLWPAASMHKNKTLDKNILSGNLAFSRPFFSIKKLIELIFSENKWSLNLAQSVEFLDKLIISSNSEQFYFTSYDKLFNSELNISGSQFVNLSSPEFLKTDTLEGNNLKLNYNSKIRLRGNITATSDFIIKISGVSSASTDSQIQEFVINNGTDFYDLTSNDFGTDDLTYNVNIEIIGNGLINLTDFSIYTIIEEQNFGNLSLANFTDFKVKTYDNLPEISQLDLFKEALVFVAGFFTTDSFRKELNGNSLKELSRLSALDWSKKFVEDSDSLDSLKSYGQINYFSFDNDKEKPLNLGRGRFEINNATLKDTHEAFKSMFAASSEVLVNDTMIDLNVYDDIERTNELNPIIGYYESISTYTVARFEQLNGNVVMSNYYQNFIEAIKIGRVLTANFNLNKSDFFLFRFNRMIYLEQKKATYYVISLSNYAEGNQTEVILLKS